MNEFKKLTASDAQAADWFGWSVAVSGETAVVGALGEDAGGVGTWAGAAYVFQRDQGGADGWGEVKKLTASDAGADDHFGYSVSVSGDIVVVGAGLEDPDIFALEGGAAYVFQRNEGGAGNWGEVKKLIASDAQSGDWFGYSVSVSGDTAVVGADREDAGGASNDNFGAAYVFQRGEGGADNWGEVKKLTASDAGAGDEFGSSVALNGDTAVVGAIWEDAGGRDAGAAYVFQRNAGGANNWGEVKKLTASDAQTFDWFGSSVAVSGDTAVVGADREDAGGTWAGAAYVFQRNAGGADNWGEAKKLLASDAQTFDEFGSSVAVSGETAVVGALGEDAGGVGTWAGAAYVFQRDQGGADGWGEVKKLTASDAQADDHFGYSVAVSGDTAVVGAHGEDAGGDYAGAAYVFDLLGPKATPTATPVPSEMILNVHGGACDDAIRPTKCEVPVGAPFTLSVEILAGPEQGYVAAQSFIHYGDDLVYNVAASATDEIVWPDCEAATAVRGQEDYTNPLPGPTGYTVNHGCATGLLPPLPVISYVGDFVQISMTCSSAESTTDVFQLPYTEVWPPSQTVQYTSGSAFQIVSGLHLPVVVPKLSDLTINCIQPPPPVGGISLGGELAALPLETSGASGGSHGVVTLSVAIAAAVVVLGGIGWYATRRRLR